MSITTEVRSYADAAVVQGKAVVAGAQGRLGAVADGARKEAAKDAYALLGAGDAAVTSLSKRGGEVPSDVDGRLAALQAELVKIGQAIEEFANNLPDSAVALAGKGQQALAKAQEILTDLRTRSEALLEQARAGDLRSDTKTKLNGYIASALIVRDSFAVRGEKTLADLRRDPRLASLFGAAEAKPTAAEPTVAEPIAEPTVAEPIVAATPAPQAPVAPVTPASAAVAAPPAKAAKPTPPKTAPSTTAAKAPGKTAAPKINEA